MVDLGHRRLVACPQDLHYGVLELSECVLAHGASSMSINYQGNTT